MISKALRPADPGSKLLKRVSHHFLSDTPDVSAGEPDTPHLEETNKEVTEEAVAKAKLSSGDNTTSGSASKSAPTGRTTEPGTPPGLPSSAEPRAEFPGATATSRHHVSLHLILVFGLITLFGLWGYRYWHTGHDTMKPTATRAVTAKQYRQQSQPVVAVTKDTQATPSVAAAPVTQAPPLEPVAAGERTPEPAAPIESASKPVAPPPPPGYRPPAYRPYPPPAAWPQPRFYGNYPPPLFRQALPPRSFRGQATAPEETE